MFLLPLTSARFLGQRATLKQTRLASFKRCYVNSWPLPPNYQGFPRPPPPANGSHSHLAPLSRKPGCSSSGRAGIRLFLCQRMGAGAPARPLVTSQAFHLQHGSPRLSVGARHGRFLPPPQPRPGLKFPFCPFNYLIDGEEQGTWPGAAGLPRYPWQESAGPAGASRAKCLRRAPNTSR